MNCLSLSIRGANSSLKKERIRKHIKKGQFEVCFLQETKTKHMDGGKCGYYGAEEM